MRKGLRRAYLLGAVPFVTLVLALVWKRMTKTGAFAGIVTGIAVAAGPVFTKHDPLWGLNAGFIALVANALVTVAASLMLEVRFRHPPHRL